MSAVRQVRKLALEVTGSADKRTSRDATDDVISLSRQPGDGDRLTDLAKPA